MTEENKMKKRPAGITFNIDFDADTGEIEDYLWDEDHDPPAMVKPEKNPDLDKSNN